MEKRQTTIRYSITGALLGLLFPLIGTTIEVAIGQGLPLTLNNYFSAQANNPLLWVIDIAPLVIGALAGFAGSRQDKLSLVNENLKGQVSDPDSLGQKLAAVTTDLEKRIDERTIELEKQNKYLEAAALVAREATLSLSPQELMDRAVKIISDHIDFYHVGIFLVDEQNENAILRAVSSEGGRQMIARGHSLGVGKQGIVGFVTGMEKARISQDIGLDRIHATTPELPNTRSEMALPLKARGSIIGALDIQDDKDNAFSNKDITALQILSDQIALAIDNARLNQQIQKSHRETQKSISGTSRQSIQDLFKDSHPSYKFSAGGPEEIAKIDVENYKVNKDSGTIEVPINIRGQKIGTIDIIRGEDSGTWGEEEAQVLESVSEQIGIAIDSARLFNETQTQAASERIISEVSAEIRETMDISTIVKTAAEKIRLAMNLPEVTIRMADPASQIITNGGSSDESA